MILVILVPLGWGLGLDSMVLRGFARGWGKGAGDSQMVLWVFAYFVFFVIFCAFFVFFG